MIWLAWGAFLALAVVGAVIVLVRSSGRDEFDCEIDEELLESDLRHELSDISFRRAGE